jgi:polysaccharide export outer membrane protein
MKTANQHLPAWQFLMFRQYRSRFLSGAFVRAGLSLCLTFVAARLLLAADAPQWPTNGSTEATGAPSITISQIATGGTTNSMESLDEKHKLAIGDLISFRIVEDEEDPKTLSITDSGELEVPYIGRFQAAGKTCKELARQLKTELEKEYYYQATVIIAVNIMAKSRGRVYLVGPVHAPGPQEIPSDEVLTLSKAILRAGGFTDFADKKDVKVTRQAKTAGGKDETFIINVERVLVKGTMESDLRLEPGDLIYVPEKLVRF